MKQHGDRTGAEARLAAGARAFRGRIVTSSAFCLALLLAGALAAAAPVTTDSAAVRGPAHAAPSEAKQRLDLNRASLEDIQRLPVPPEVARAIWEHRTYVEYFGSIYDLMEVPGMTPEILERLRPLVSTLPPESKDEVFRRYDASFRQVQQFLSEEGSREELADEYLDLLREPRNINRMNLFDLQSFQNVSPVDAVAILKAREAAGRIENERQLRSSEGLSYWGFRNLRDYVIYEDPKTRDELHGDVQLVTFDTPYALDAKDLLTQFVAHGASSTKKDSLDFAHNTGWGIRGLDSANPAVLTKVRMRLGNDWKGGLLTFRQVGEEHLAETVKGFASWQNPEMRGSRQDQEARTGLRRALYSIFAPDRIVLGNYRLAFGQGLVMDNTDYFLPRKTGYGWNTRPRSILGDLSRSQEFQLRGVAVEQHYGPVFGVAFFSRDHKDGLLNPDGSINKYVVMSPRFENKELEAMHTEQGRFGLRRDAFLETTYGGNLRGQLWKGTYIGVSGYEARYDKPWNPDINTLIHSTNVKLLDTRDSELFQDYDSRALGKFRRVVGADFQTVYENVAVQGEYAKLDANPQSGLKGLFSTAPEAYTVNAYVQYEDLNIQALWRDYDLGFDNPYARAFSNDSRHEQTLLGDPFRDQNPLLAWVALNTPQMKPERGLYVGLRYRVSRNFTITGLEFDNWTRVADGQDAQRYTARCEYSPIFPLRFRLRQRFSSRSELGIEDIRKFQGWDTRLEMQVRLSDYDELRLLYSTTKTEFAPRARLSGRAEPPTGSSGNPRTPLGQAASPSQAVQAALMHNVNDRLLLGVSSELYDGFLYNFEDNEFVVVDDKGFRNWLLVRSRLSDSMLLRFKFTYDRSLTRNNLDIRYFENASQFLFEGDDVRAQRTSFRLQLDYTY